MDIITAALAASMSGGGGGGTGTDDYNELSNKPKINGVTLAGNKSLSGIGAAAADETYTDEEVDALLSEKADADDVYTKAQTDAELAKKVDKETGKGLSTNDFTNADKENLATALEKANAAAPQATTYTKGQVDAALAGKVDKVDGKGLSTEDFTAAEKSKLAGIAAGAEVNVQANWAQTSSSADDFIKNKPTLGAAASKGVDSTPTASSTNLVTSGGVATALAAKLNTADVDDALSSTSTNPLQNKVVKGAIDGKQDSLSTAQLAAVNSGIAAEDVAQIETNKNNIALLAMRKVYATVRNTSTTHTYTVKTSDFNNSQAGTYLITIVTWSATPSFSLYAVSYSGNVTTVTSLTKIAGADANISVTDDVISCTTTGKIQIIAVQ